MFATTLTRRPPSWWCSEETPPRGGRRRYFVCNPRGSAQRRHRHEGGRKDFAPIYRVTIAAGRRLPRCVDFPFGKFDPRRYPPARCFDVATAVRACACFPCGNFDPRRYPPAHSRQQSTSSEKREFWQRDRAPGRLTKINRFRRVFNTRHSTTNINKI